VTLTMCLQEDNALSVEELLAKYNQPADSSAQPSDDEEEDEESESSEEEESSEESTEEDVDLSSLLEDAVSTDLMLGAWWGT
jgi:ribosomal protein L12E/L44/L45/RPP1/RPP2